MSFHGKISEDNPGHGHPNFIKFNATAPCICGTDEPWCATSINSETLNSTSIGSCTGSCLIENVTRNPLLFINNSGKLDWFLVSYSISNFHCLLLVQEEKSKEETIDYFKK